MAIIYIMRHGIAEDAGASLPDSERRLTDEGRQKTSEVARGLKLLDVKPEVVLASPLVRAWQTAEIATDILGAKRLEEYKPLAPGGSSEMIVRGLKDYSRVGELMLVGHEPSVGELASYFLTGSSGLVPLAFKKAAVAAIEVGVLPPRVAGALLWFMTPKQIRQIRG